MQKIISLIFILSILCIKINAQTTVIDDGSFLYIQGSSIQRVHIHKDLCAVQKTADKVILTFSSNNTPFVFSWNVAQSTAYKGGLNQTYDYIVGLLNTISTSTPPPSPNAGDSLLSSKIDTLINYVKMTDTTQIDTPLVNYIFQFDRQNDTLSAILNTIKTKQDTSNQAILNMIKQNIADSLRTSVYVKNDSINVHVLNSVVDSTYYLQLDSVVKLLNAKDTIDFEFYKYCYRSKADSGVYNFNIIFNIKNTSFPVFMNLIDVDSMIEIFRADYINNVFIGTFPNYANDYIPCERWEEYLNRLDTIKDTLKALVFKPLTKNITGTQDTLYNCKGLSFRANSGASGTLVLYYEDGETDSYDVANEDLPIWDNSAFISFVGYDASGVVGKLRINAVGCSQVPDNGCAKVVPLLDCENSTPIPTCIGWASFGGVWQSASGCWNTGQ